MKQGRPSVDAVAVSIYKNPGGACDDATAWACAVETRTLTWDATNSVWNDVVTCLSGIATTANQNQCNPTTTYTPNCATFHASTGVCIACNSGYVLRAFSGNNEVAPTRQNIPSTMCLKAIPNCTVYNASGTCKTCGANEKGETTSADVNNNANVCLAASQKIRGCGAY